MAEVIWTDPALSDLDAIGDYIALDNPEGGESFGAERALTCGHLVVHPKSSFNL